MGMDTLNSADSIPAILQELTPQYDRPPFPVGDFSVEQKPHVTGFSCDIAGAGSRPASAICFENPAAQLGNGPSLPGPRGIASLAGQDSGKDAGAGEKDFARFERPEGKPFGGSSVEKSALESSASWRGARGGGEPSARPNEASGTALGGRKSSPPDSPLSAAISTQSFFMTREVVGPASGPAAPRTPHRPPQRAPKRPHRSYGVHHAQVIDHHPHHGGGDGAGRPDGLRAGAAAMARGAGEFSAPAAIRFSPVRRAAGDRTADRRAHGGGDQRYGTGLTGEIGGEMGVVMANSNGESMGRARAGLWLCGIVLFAVLTALGGCASVSADQDRLVAVTPVIGEHVERHPEQAETWESFLRNWQKSIDARRGLVFGRD